MAIYLGQGGHVQPDLETSPAATGGFDEQGEEQGDQRARRHPEVQRGAPRLAQQVTEDTPAVHADTDRERQCHHEGLPVIEAVAGHRPHTLHEQHSHQNEQVSPHDGAGNGQQEGRQLGQERQCRQESPDQVSHAAGRHPGETGKGRADGRVHGGGRDPGDRGQ